MYIIYMHFVDTTSSYCWHFILEEMKALHYLRLNLSFYIYIKKIEAIDNFTALFLFVFAKDLTSSPLRELKWT